MKQLNFTPSHLLEYLFCPRFTYYEYVLKVPQQADKYFKVVKGREVHKQKARQAASYLRKRIGVVEKWDNVYMSMSGLRGEVDEALLLDDGTMAPLDYKFARFEGKVYDTYRTQLACYALLLEHTYGKVVEKGYLVYVRSKNHLEEVLLTEKIKDEVSKDLAAMQRIIGGNYYPRPTRYKKRCVDCTYRMICVR